jgi:hypothetical protein
MLLSFEEEREVAFKEEVYFVRDNGAVRRRARVNVRRRRLDDVWTFGSLNKQTGYLVVSDHVVHRIVATAFHGPCPSTDHVVDHIDTNRRNNRAENLRWVTRLENVLLNPITLRRIELAFGSVEAFLANPRAHAIPNCEWMRPVTKEEAAVSRARLLKWAQEGKAPTGGVLGDWLFSLRSKPIPEPKPEPLDTPSLTAGAFQRKWRTPTEFPLCPAPDSEGTLDTYLDRLRPGSVFARNRYGESEVVEADKGADNSLSVVCHGPSGVKDWTIARIFVEGGRVCHESGGTFFTKTGALKAHLRALGVTFDEALYESIDDYA